MDEMFELIINIIETPCLGIKVVFNKIRSFH